MSEAQMVRYVLTALAEAGDRDPRLGVILVENSAAEEPHKVASVYVELRDNGIHIYLYLTGASAPIQLRGDVKDRPTRVRDIQFLEAGLEETL